MPFLVKFMFRHALIGGAMAIVFVAVLLALDVGGLATLIKTSRFGLMAVALLTFFTGLTFGSLQMGIAIMSMKSEDEESDAGGHEAGSRDLELKHAPVLARKRRR